MFPRFVAALRARLGDAYMLSQTGLESEPQRGDIS